MNGRTRSFRASTSGALLIGKDYDTSKFDVIVLCADNFQYIGQDYLFKEQVVIRCPFEDVPRGFSEAEEREILKTAYQAARRWRGGESVLVTCAAGVNRSAMMAALILRLLSPARDPDEIIALIRKQRKLDYGEALFNETFVKYIKSEAFKMAGRA